MIIGNCYPLSRFILKAAFLSAAAVLQSRGNSWSVAASLFFVTATLDVLIALVRREQPKNQSLIYWDEGAAFLVLSGIAAAIGIGSSK